MQAILRYQLQLAIDSSTISLNTLRSTTFASGEIGLRTGLYSGGFYYNKVYCVYLVASTVPSLSPAYFVSDRNWQMVTECLLFLQTTRAQVTNSYHSS